MTYGDTEHKVILNTCGYLVFDFICYKFIVGAKGILAIQTFLHHILGSMAYYSALYTGGASIKLGIICLSLEVSTIFVNLRWFTFEFKVKSNTIPLLNSAMIFISYFLFRVVMQSYLAYFYIYPMFWRQWVNFEFLQTYEHLDIRVYTVMGYYQLFANVLSQAMNLYWFKLICAQVKRNLKKALGFEIEAYKDPQHGAQINKDNK